jgi:hypothetical protein
LEALLFFMNIDLNTFVYETILPAANELFAKAAGGDVTTIALIGIGIIVCFVMLILLIELAAWMIGLIKRFFLFLIVASSTALFFFSFQDKIFVPNPDLVLVASGAIGVIFAIVALSISIISLKREWVKPKAQKVADLKSEMKKLVVKRFEDELQGKAVKEARPAVTATKVQAPQMMSTQALTAKNILSSFHDRSLLAVLSYMVVAEFGVISGVTISAPNASVGLMFFAMFLIAALIFIKSTYHNYLTGLKHLFVALAVGGILSIVLSNVWLGVPLENLISMSYFQTNALVALVTGLAVSLFMGSKG